MHSTHLRKEHIHGLLLGVAIGDALGRPRRGLRRRVALRMFGRIPRYRLFPGTGIYGDETQLMLINAQALLKSRSDLKALRHYFRKRLSWYPLCLPVGIRQATLATSAKCWLMRFKQNTGVNSAGSGAATRAIFSALAIHGTGHRLARWIEESTKLTHTHPLSVDGCQVLAALADFGATNKIENFDSMAALEVAIASCSTPEIKTRLGQIADFLQAKRGPTAVARKFGWECGIGEFIVPTCVMATYIFLRYPQNFTRAVQSAIALGGDSDTLAAIVGGLVGGHVGSQNLPQELVDGLASYPHGPAWIKKLAERFSHWPHGSDDLHLAPAQRTDPLFQILLNLGTVPLNVVNEGLRIPFRMSTKDMPRSIRAD